MASRHFEAARQQRINAPTHAQARERELKLEARRTVGVGGYVSM